MLCCAAFSVVQELDREQLKSELVKVDARIPKYPSRENLLEAVKANQTTWYLKVWHDHCKITGLGHLLVLVESMFDQAFLYTSQEMAQRGVNIDIPTTVCLILMLNKPCTMKSVSRSANPKKHGRHTRRDSNFYCTSSMATVLQLSSNAAKIVQGTTHWNKN